MSCKKTNIKYITVYYLILNKLLKYKNAFKPTKFR